MRSVLKRDRPIDAGDLDQPLTIVNFSGAQDAAGHVLGTETTIATLFGAIRAMTGGELFIARQAQSKATHKITIRYTDGVDTSMRVKHAAKTYELLSIADPDQRREWLELLACEIQGSTP